MKITISVPAWRPRSVAEMDSERVASILLCFALLCIALLCVAPLGFALLRMVWETGMNDGMNKGINDNPRDSSSPAGGAGGAPGGDFGGFQKRSYSSGKWSLQGGGDRNDWSEMGCPNHLSAARPCLAGVRARS